MGRKRKAEDSIITKRDVMKKIILFLICLILFSPLWAASDYYQFDTKEKQIRFEALTSTLRCLVCQNENLTESNATLASDLREQIYKKVVAGESNSDIIQYLTTRYGNFILYQPPVNSLTIVLWIAPGIGILFGLSFLFYYLYRRKNTIC